ncbi:hydrolase [Kitasatospora sp. RB6PN24]|uniref:alpha/beta hydrolase n=1 Tax=Kitasatospora humi TaxID=2893891 RepID=UPI001E6139FC|nr:hydrolase [Kitasatospora humi]MCC9309738.1 hydrolase [Kitasatospora humi]
MTIRKVLLAAALSAALVGTVAATPALAAPAPGTTGPAAAARSGPARLTQPAPTGRYQLGTVSLHLTDTSRADPWVSSPAHRELMISVVYPAVRADRYPLAPQFTPGEAAAFDRYYSGALDGALPVGAVDWAGTLTHAHQGAPADTGHGRFPVVLYSPGAGDPRNWDSTLVDDLASHGYVVVTIDHTYEAPGVQFPDGSVRTSALTPQLIQQAEQDGTIQALMQKVMDTRVADTRFVMDQLTTPGTLPPALAQTADTTTIGMFGHSAGGYTAAETMHDDPRLLAGVNMDGPLGNNQLESGTNLAPVAADGLDRPLLLIGTQQFTHHTVAAWDAFWQHTRGWSRDLNLPTARHASLTDAEAYLPQLARQGVLPAATVTNELGTADVERTLCVERTYLADFFDQWLKHRPVTAFDRPALPPESFIQ